MTPGKAMGAADATAEAAVDGARRDRSFLRRVSGDVLRISGAVGLAQILAFAAAPLLTRIYDPASFGHFAVLGAAVTILTPLASLRFSWALPLPRTEEEALDLLGLCLVVSAGVALLAGLLGAGLLGVAAGPAAGGWFAVGARDVLLLAAALLTVGLHEVATHWLVRQQAFGAVAGVRFITLVGTVACQILFGLLDPGAGGLMLGFIGGYLLGLLRAAHHGRAALAGALRAMEPRRLGRVAGLYRRFALVTAPSGVLNGVGGLLPAMAMPPLYGLAVTGQWSLAVRVLWQPTAFVGQAVSQVLWGHAARLRHEDPGRLWFLVVALNLGLLVAMTPALVLVWHGEALFALVFGPDWATAGRFAGIIVLSSVVSLAAQGTTSLHVYGLNHWMSGWEVARLALVAGTLALVWRLELPALDCVIALTVATAVSDAALLALNLLAVWRIRTAAGRPGADPAAPHSPKSPA